MSNIFKLDSDVEEVKASDSLGKYTLDSGLHNFKIKQAFLDKSRGGARCLSLELLLKGTELTYDHQIYFTSKANPDQMFTEKNGKKMPTFGYNKINDLCKRAAGMPLTEVELEDKQVSVWGENRQKENQKRKVLDDLIGADIAIGVKEIREAKWDDDTKPVLKNELDKFFDPETYLTTAEIEAGKTEAKFAETWKGKFEGVLDDQFKEPTTKSGAPTGGDSKPAADIFAD